MGGLSAGVPAYVLPARAMGDFSSVLKGPGAAISRDVNRLAGKVAGGAFAAANTSRFGVFGMIATAQFFSILKQVVQLQIAEEAGAIHMGTVMMYGGYYENGSPGIRARPFMEDAIKSTPFRASRAKRSAIPSGLRSGLYFGQKFQDDFAGFYRGDTINRIGRRELGREISGFWGALRLGADTEAPNILEGFAKRIIRKSKTNITKMGQDTGTLRASMTYGFGSQEMSEKSRALAMEHISAGGHHLKRTHKVLDGVVAPGAGNISADVVA